MACTAKQKRYFLVDEQSYKLFIAFLSRTNAKTEKVQKHV